MLIVNILFGLSGSIGNIIYLRSYWLKIEITPPIPIEDLRVSATDCRQGISRWLVVRDGTECFLGIGSSKILNFLLGVLSLPKFVSLLLPPLKIMDLG